MQHQTAAVLQCTGNEWQKIKLKESEIFQLSGCGTITMVASFDGKVWSWEEPQRVPRQLQRLTPIKQIACGDSHSLALSFSGSVYSWGSGIHGQLGHGVYESSAPPQKIVALGPYKVSQVAASARASTALCAGEANGWVLYWGRLTSGTVQSLPVVVEELLPCGRLRVVRLIGGGSNFGVVLNSGAIFLWGPNSSGQLGTGDLEPRCVPTQILLGQTGTNDVAADEEKGATSLAQSVTPTTGCRVLQLCVGRNSCVAVSDTGSMWLWGDVGLDCEGHLSTSEWIEPRVVIPPNERPVIRAFVSSRNGLCVTDDGSVFAWFGELAAATFGPGVIGNESGGKRASLVAGVFTRVKPLCGKGLIQAIVTDAQFSVVCSRKHFDSIVERRSHQKPEHSDESEEAEEPVFSSSPAVSRALAELSHRRAETPTPESPRLSQRITSGTEAETLMALLCPSLRADSEFGEELRIALSLALKQREAIERRFAEVQTEELPKTLGQLLGKGVPGGQRELPLLDVVQLQSSEKLVTSALLALATRDALLEGLTVRNAELEGEASRLRVLLEQERELAAEAAAAAQHEVALLKLQFEEKEQRWRNTVQHLKSKSFGNGA